MNRQDNFSLAANSDIWSDCQPGTLSQLARRQRMIRQRKTALRRGTPILFALVLGLTVWIGSKSNSPAEFDFAGVTCNEVQTSLQQYVMGELNVDMMSSFALHLEQCSACSEKLQTRQNPPASVAQTPIPKRAHRTFEVIASQHFGG
ncbi:zf-HC2 domain-containing protein [Novipirellula sp. SH528]|uniref:zf-HC2 domain-containing protein n=1 Tax=Novipirellula sp. SH528 TaxID=3454466 RepID=UPI003FA04EE8